MKYLLIDALIVAGQVEKNRFRRYIIYINEVMPVKKILRLAGEAIVKYGMIADGDRIAVGVSGGKDSLTLLEVLRHFQQTAPVRFSLVPVTFDPGFPEFGLPELRSWCLERCGAFESVRLDIPALLAQKHYTGTPCVLCSRLRRGKLYGLCSRLGCGKLALGQHLDDVITSFLMSLCRGQGLQTMAPMVPPQTPGRPAVIRPLVLVPEAEIVRVSAALPKFGRCPWEAGLQDGDRRRFGALVESLSREIPGLRSNIARSLSQVKTAHLLTVPETAGQGLAEEK